MPGLVAGWFGRRLIVADERLAGFDRRSGAQGWRLTLNSQTIKRGGQESDTDQAAIAGTLYDQRPIVSAAFELSPRYIR